MRRISPRQLKDDLMAPVRITILTLALLTSLAWGRTSAFADEPTGAIKVALSHSNDGWQLSRGGKPYYIFGAGGTGSLDLLASCGGNSNRTWSVGKKTIERLDEAHRNGLSVTVGLWLEHPSRGFDYQDFQQVHDQIDKVMKAVRELKITLQS